MSLKIDFKKEYLKWLNENIEQSEIDEDTYRITLPFLDRNNDYIELYILKNIDNYRITDDGNTLNELEFSRVNLKTETRQEILTSTINYYGVQISDRNELFVEGTSKDIILKKHLLLQCMIKISEHYFIDDEEGFYE